MANKKETAVTKYDTKDRTHKHILSSRNLYQVVYEVFVT